MDISTSSNTSEFNRPKKIQVGFLCYDLQPVNEDCLYRVSRAITPIELKAYPVIYHPNQEKARVPYYPSFEKGRYFGANVKGSTPEGFASNINWRAAWRCVCESDIVFLFGLQGGTALVAGLLASLIRRTLISVNQTLPPEWERKRRWWVRLLKKWLLNRCAYHVYQTPTSKEVLVSVYKIIENRMFYAPCDAGASWFKGILEQYRNQRDNTRSWLGLTNEVIFLFVGNLHPFKGVSDLIRAASRMDKDAKYVCVFAGPEEPRNKVGGTIDYYMDLAQKLGVEHYVRFLGPLSPEKLASLYWVADVVMLPTYRDMFPKVLVEGALAAKPIITTNANGAAGTIVIDGYNGFVIEPGDVGSLTAAMARLLDSELRQKMGNRSLEIVNRFCDREAETKGYFVAIKHALSLKAIEG
jgi:glycosyltransferase involved in cell wall biosynthesis